MAKIRKIYDETIKPNGEKTVIYPITSTRAVYTPTSVTIDSLLNEGYRFGGIVLPTDSPSITDQRVFYGASVPGNYANFGGINVDGGEAIFFMWDGTTWHKGIFGGAGSNNLTGFKSLASITDLPNEPTMYGYLINDYMYVWVGENGDTLSGTYQNVGQLRGASAYEVAVRNGYEGTEQQWLADPVNGIKGVSVTSVTEIGTHSDANSAENTYRITLSNNEKLDMKVKNGKGINSVTVVGNYSSLDGATNTYRISLSDNTVFEFQVKNGSQGNTGSSVDYPFELLNALDSTATDKGVTASKIKELNEDVTHIGTALNSTDTDIKHIGDYAGTPINPVTHERAVLDDDGNSIEPKLQHAQDLDNALINTTTYDSTALHAMPKSNYVIVGSTGKWGDVSTVQHVRIDVNPGDCIYVTADDNHAAGVAFLSETSPATSGGTPNYAGGATNRTEVPEGKTQRFVAPSDAVQMYLYAGTSAGGYGYLPESVIFRRVPVTENTPLMKVNVLGRGNATSSVTMSGLIAGHTYRVHILSWDASLVTSDSSYYLFFISATDSSDNVTYLITVPMNGTLAAYYDFTVPSNIKKINVGGRCNLNTYGVVEIEDISTIVDKTHVPLMTAKIPGAGTSYVRFDINDTIVGHTYRAYIKQLTNTMSLSSAYVYFAIRSSDGNETSDLVKVYFGTELASYYDFTVPTGSQLIYTELRADLGTVAIIEFADITAFSGLDEAISDIEMRALPEWHIEGAGDTYKSMRIYSLIPGHKYRLHIKQWEHNNVTVPSGSYLLFAASNSGGQSFTTLLAVPDLVDLANFYEISVPKNSQFVTFGGRANNGTIGIVAIEDITVEVRPYDNQLNVLRYRMRSQADTMGLLPLSIPTDENGWELPQSVQQLNAMKKALQFCSIKWTPKATLPGKNNGSHAAGVEQTGIPYSGNLHYYKYVGIEVSIHTFMTAVNNPYSLLYTENVSGTNSKSAWGRTYYNSNGWMYYGTVCCGLTSYLNGQPKTYGNAVIPMAAKTFGTYIPIYPDREFDVLKIADIYNCAAHAIFIYGLKRDASGHVTNVRIAESTGAKTVNSCRFRDFTRSEFLSYVNRSGDHFYPYRCTTLFRNLDYEPSEYVPLEQYGETADPVTYNNEICCFAGDKATFMVGDRIAVNYNLTGAPLHTWTAIELYKDDELLNTYQLSSINQSALDESQRDHALDLGTTLTAGMYKARMTDGTNYSDYTYWEVLPNNVTVTENSDGSYKIKATGPYKMVYVNLGKTQSTGWFYNKAGREPSSYEYNANIVNLFFDELLDEWGYDGRANNQIRVMFKGEYGMAATPPITLPGRVEAGGDDPTPEPVETD